MRFTFLRSNLVAIYVAIYVALFHCLCKWIIEDSPGTTEQSLSQLTTRKANYYGLERWTPHDLRRTARTLMARLGVIEEEVGAVLNHAKQGMAKVYNLRIICMEYDDCTFEGSRPIKCKNIVLP